MVSTLTRRVERLEGSFGGGEVCPRCAGTIVVIGVSGEVSVTRNGTHLAPEAAKAFHREEQPGDICPRCDESRRKVVVGWGHIR